MFIAFTSNSVLLCWLYYYYWDKLVHLIQVKIAYYISRDHNW